MAIHNPNLEDQLKHVKELAENQQYPAADPQKINLHMHTSFSFNAYGWSPAEIAVQAKKYSFYAAGIIDFDVLDGMEEFTSAAEILGLRATVGIETRTFNKYLAEKEIDSPGEPGVSYVSGTGFTRKPEGAKDRFLDKLKATSHQRNQELISRINTQLGEIAIDYAQDVLPMTPSGNATERHIIRAYIEKSRERMQDENKLEAFWKEVLQSSDINVKESITTPAFANKVRARLAKKGGIGYVTPTSSSFPQTENVFNWISLCGAIPVESWLDGTSEGEADPERLLEQSVSMGARALNIIPDRNWNISDPGKQNLKYKNLQEVINTARAMQLPVMIGTELNKTGQPLYDDISNDYLKPFAQDFLSGANIIIGHHILSKFAGFPYAGEKATQKFGESRQKMNLYFSLVGALPPVTTDLSIHLSEAGEDEAFGIIADSVKKGNWKF